MVFLAVAVAGPSMDDGKRRGWLVAAGLIAANAVPLVGVLGFGWDLHSLLVIYWVESAVVGIGSVAKILRSQGEDDPEDLPSLELNDRPVASFVGRSKGWIASFFVFHYGVFWAVHGVFVFVFAAVYPELRLASAGVVLPAAAGLALYHAVSYRVNYIGGGEHRRSGPVTLMIEPYRRVTVLHVTIVGGGFLIGWWGVSIGLVSAMVITKTALDLHAHRTEHERARQRSPPASAPS